MVPQKFRSIFFANDQLGLPKREPAESIRAYP
jgi:hypothetical protein